MELPKITLPAHFLLMPMNNNGNNHDKQDLLQYFVIYCNILQYDAIKTKVRHINSNAYLLTYGLWGWNKLLICHICNAMTGPHKWLMKLEFLGAKSTADKEISWEMLQVGAGGDKKKSQKCIPQVSRVLWLHFLFHWRTVKVPGSAKDFWNWLWSTETQQPVDRMWRKARGCLVHSVLCWGNYSGMHIPELLG